MVEQKKPVGALCIAPVLFAKILGETDLTIGQDKATADAVKAMGANHKETTHGEVIIDEKYKLVTTPCYMLDASIAQIGDGANNLVKAIIEMT